MLTLFSLPPVSVHKDSKVNFPAPCPASLQENSKGLMLLDRDTTCCTNRSLEGCLSQVEQKPSQLDGLVKLASLRVCTHICPKLCIRLISAWSLSSIWGSSYEELSPSVLVRGTCEAWRCSEAISYCRGPSVANKARPNPRLLLPSFSSPFSSPLIPGHCHGPRSSTSQAKGAALASVRSVTGCSDRDVAGL